MLKVLLVDDEPFILQGLSVIIDWNGEGFEIAGMASNAFEALEVLKREKIDLVIADIKMPKMTGLELLEKVKDEKISDAHFVILSGYNDFDYVRTALRNECLDYMLKPVEQEELLNVLHKVREFHEFDDTVPMVDSLRSFDLGEPPNWYQADRLVDKQLVDALIRAVKLNDKEGIEKGYELLFDEMRRGGLDMRMINMVVNYLMFELLHLASEQDENISQQEVFQFINEGDLTQIDIDDKDNISRLLMKYGDYLMQLRTNQGTEVLGQIEADIRENYRENMTLKDLSKKYYVNAAYLGQNFKKKYGEPFKDYLNRVRIEAAEELLLYSDKKIYEIAEEVGYKDLDYFINKFIALNGCTPAKFRKQVK